MKRIMTTGLALLVTAILSPGLSMAAANRQNVTLTTGDGMRFTLSVVTPSIWTPNTALPLILALPPGSGDLNMVNSFLGNYWLQEADRRGYIVVSPTVMGRSLETSGREVLDTIFDWMDRNVSYDPERMALVGQSNGGLGAFHVARVRPDWFTTMVVMPGGYGGRGELDMLEGMPVLLAVGEQDAGWVQLTHNTRDLLRLAGAEPTVSIVPGAGHVFPYDPEKLFDWIQASFLE